MRNEEMENSGSEEGNERKIKNHLIKMSNNRLRCVDNKLKRLGEIINECIGLHQKKLTRIWVPNFLKLE